MYIMSEQWIANNISAYKYTVSEWKNDKGNNTKTLQDDVDMARKI